MEKKISTGISPEFVKDWTQKEAIREILQNYLDSKKEFDCRGQINWKDGVAVVRDHGPGIAMRHLALGVSEKDESCIGKFGKGLKQALLVMARENKAIKIISQGRQIIPIIEFSDDYQTNILHLIVKDAEGHGKQVVGTWIEFECSQEELEEAKKYFLEFTPKKKLKFLGKNREVFLPGGNVYINDSKIGSVDDALFSYRLTNEQAASAYNSERNMVDKDKLRDIIRDIISKTSNREMSMKILRSALLEECNSFEAHLGIHYWMLRNKNIWINAFGKVAGDNAVIHDTDAAANEASYRGYKPIRMNYNWSYPLKNIGVPTATEVVTKIKRKEIEFIPEEHLTPKERWNLRQAMRFIKELFNDPGNVKIVNDLNDYIGVAADSGVCTRGVYSAEKDLTMIRRDLLTDLLLTTEVIFHETVHRVTGFNDKTVEFEKALCRSAAKIILNAKGRSD